MSPDVVACGRMEHVVQLSNEKQKRRSGERRFHEVCRIKHVPLQRLTRVSLDYQLRSTSTSTACRPF